MHGTVSQDVAQYFHRRPDLWRWLVVSVSPVTVWPVQVGGGQYRRVTPHDATGHRILSVGRRHPCRADGIGQARRYGG